MLAVLKQSQPGQLWTAIPTYLAAAPTLSATEFSADFAENIILQAWSVVMTNTNDVLLMLRRIKASHGPNPLH